MNGTPRPPVRAVLAAVLGALCVALAGCGVGAQRQPVAIDVPVPGRSPAEPAPGGPRTVTVYLVRADRLEPARRDAPEATVARALEQLAAGPTALEARDGLRSAVAPASLTAGALDPATGTVVVDVTREFVATSGGAQLLAVAQVVWTVTEAPEARRVRVTSGGNPVEVPTDEGLSSEPVTRADYLGVAPVPRPSPGPSPDASDAVPDATSDRADPRPSGDDRG